MDRHETRAKMIEHQLAEVDDVRNKVLTDIQETVNHRDTSNLVGALVALHKHEIELYDESVLGNIDTEFDTSDLMHEAN